MKQFMEGRWHVVMALVALLTLGVAKQVHAEGPGINGRVLGLDEKGIPVGSVAGAKIEFKNVEGKVAGTGATDEKGNYKVNLPPGTYTYKIQAAGFKDENAARALTLTLSEGYALHNFSLSRGKTDPTRRATDSPTGPLNPAEVKAQNADSARTVGTPIPGSTDGKWRAVTLVWDDGQWVATTKMDAADKFEFKNLKAGNYRLVVSVEKNSLPGTTPTDAAGTQTVVRPGDQLDAQRVFRITNVRVNGIVRAEGITELVGDVILLPVDPNTGRSLQVISIANDGGTISGNFKVADNESPRPQDRIRKGMPKGGVAPDAVAAPVDPNAWRYKQENGQWWYYNTNNQWMIYTNGAWVLYTAPVKDAPSQTPVRNPVGPGVRVIPAIPGGIIPGMGSPGGGIFPGRQQPTETKGGNSGAPVRSPFGGKK